MARLHLIDALAALPIPRRAWHARRDRPRIGWRPARRCRWRSRAPDIEWTLVDSVGKKATVLRDFAEALGLRNVTVLGERAELLGRDPRHRERHETVTARACAPLPVLAELGLPLLAIGGALLAWKGPLSESDEEVQRGRVAIGRLGGGSLQIRDPGLPALGGHRLVIVAKERATPSRFPRRPGQPGQRPLG